MFGGDLSGGLRNEGFARKRRRHVQESEEQVDVGEKELREDRVGRLERLMRQAK